MKTNAINYFLLLASLMAQGVSSHRNSLVKVLVFNRSGELDERSHHLDPAPSLSIDVPQYELDSRVNTTSQGSSNYRQISLASLTLQQFRGTRSSGHESSEEPNQIDSSNRTNFNSNKPHPRARPSDWQELTLPRVKPSWLSIGKQFRITDTSISEVESFVPSEYMMRPAFDSPILLRTKLGIIEGVRSIKFNKYLYTFLSVPYAQPPIGALRFKLPQPVKGWDGIYQATKWPPFCVQPSMTLASKSSPVHIMSQIMTEDCLYLNIWTPSLKLNRNYRRPVMVWLHGGAFQYGGISVDENDGSALALLGDVVVVTLNYRISAFGFLNSDNKLNGPNNVGLHDQRMALEWVQANIKQFGGDPLQVTLFGESAGGHSVGLHLISPGSYNLFKRVIMQSGVPTSMLRSYDANKDNEGPLVSEGAIMVARRLKCYEDDNPITEDSSELETEENSSPEQKPILSDLNIECLRNKTSLEILKALGAPGSSGFFPVGNDPEGFFPNGPINESFDPENLKIGPQKEFLIGTNTDEGAFMLHYAQPSLFPAKDLPRVDSMDKLRSFIQSEMEGQSMTMNGTNIKTSSSNFTKSEIQSASGSGGGGAHAHLFRPLMRLQTSLLDRFMPTNNNSNTDKRAQFARAIGNLVSDIIFLCPSRSLAKTLADSGRNVHFYLYGHRSSTSQYHEWLGVTHHDEVEFVFGRPLRMADVYSGDDINMSQRIIKSWAHFAHTGQMLPQMGTVWPAYGPEENNYMKLESRKATVGQRYHDQFCNLYETVISVHLQEN